MLGSIVPCLASPRKKNGVKFFLSTQDGMKHPEMHKKVKVRFFWRVKKIFWVKKKIFLKMKVT